MKDVAGFANKVLFCGKNRRSRLVLIDTVIFAFINAVYYFLIANSHYGALVYNGRMFALNSLLLYVCIFACRFALRMYNNVWRYPNTKAYIFLVVSDCIGGVTAVFLSYITSFVLDGFYHGIWHAMAVASLTAMLTLMSRFAYRVLYKSLNKGDKLQTLSLSKIPIAIVGAGQLGAYLANELSTSSRTEYSPKCFIDVDKEKIGKRVCGLPVMSADRIIEAKNKYGFTEVVIAILNLDSNKYEEFWKIYDEIGCKVKVYDSPIHDGLPSGDKPEKIIRDFAIEDLLFRKPLDINRENEFKFYNGKTVLVTGGGGSIGSELSRQIAKCNPKKLIIFDIYENNVYDIQQELTRAYGSKLDLCVEIGSVRDVVRLDAVFKNYRPDIVFHAAAHKHVPLMEHSGAEAIKNNVMGTYNTANMAEKYGAQKFILVSTDKAVNPTNIMGASKRLCEMVIQCRTDSNTSFAAVRFGNVLGSNGSVIPLFKRQILSGGPVTITDKRIIRYFMTIPEASQLVIQAGAKAKRGELFVLDMGKPIRIYDLAVNMIKLMGHVPNEDIEIKEIGLRPGEKLYEELLMKTETLLKTDSEMIFIERDTPYSRDEVEEKLEILRAAVDAAADEIASPRIKEAIKQTVPTFVDPEEINKVAEQSDEMKQVKKELAVV